MVDQKLSYQDLEHLFAMQRELKYWHAFQKMVEAAGDRARQFDTPDFIPHDALPGSITYLGERVRKQSPELWKLWHQKPEPLQKMWTPKPYTGML